MEKKKKCLELFCGVSAPCPQTWLDIDVVGSFWQWSLGFPMIPTSWYPHLCVTPFVSMYMGPSDSLLMKKNIERAQVMGCHFHDEVTRESNFHLTGSLSVAGIFSYPLMSWLPCCQLSHGEAHVARNEGGPQQRRSQNSVRRPTRNWILPKNMWMSLEVNSSQISLEMTAAPWETQCQRASLSCPWIPVPQKLWNKYIVIFSC